MRACFLVFAISSSLILGFCEKANPTVGPLNFALAHTPWIFISIPYDNIDMLCFPCTRTDEFIIYGRGNLQGVASGAGDSTVHHALDDVGGHLH